MPTSRFRTLILLLILAVSALGAESCGGSATPTPAACTPPLHDYKGKCLDVVTTNFVGCTEDRGKNLTTEERQKFGATVDLGLRSVGGVVELSKKIVETENSDVATEIVKNCLELSKSVATPAEKTAIQQQVDVLQGMLDASSKGTIMLDPTRGPYSQAIAVSGDHWPANAEVEITAGTSRVRATTNAEGTFHTTITLDPRFESVSPSTVRIQVTPVKASTQFPADALYTIVK